MLFRSQEALKNVERHARARHVTVDLTQRGGLVQLTIQDDGIGFDPVRHPAKRNGKENFGLLNMRERSAYVGAALSLKSAPGQGTTIEVRIPSRMVRGGGRRHRVRSIQNLNRHE